MLFKVYLPMNWGVTTALSIVCFIWTWNAFLWPFLSVTRTEMMTITVGITQVQDSLRRLLRPPARRRRCSPACRWRWPTCFSSGG